MTQNESNTLVAGDVNKGLAYIVDHPEEYGFSWGSGAIGKGVGAQYVELRKDAPHVEVSAESLPLFALTFPKVLVKSVNGTSVKVSCDRVNRDTIDKDKTVKVDVLRAKIVSNVLLGVITRTFGPPQTKFVGADGKAYGTLEEAQKAANPANTREVMLEKARAFLAMCAENGVDHGTARMLAAQQWPTVFENVVAEENDIYESEAKDENN